MNDSHNHRISVLIPAYNAESTIVRCLDSIVNQCTDDVEVIAIDDGSKDETYRILLEYSEKYSNIHASKQENSGVAITRQKLVDMSTGKYLMFCDADDYIEPGTIKMVRDILTEHSAQEQPDLIIFGYNLVRTNGMKTVKRRKLKPGTYSYDMIAKNHVKGFGDLYWSALWNKCYRREMFFEPSKVHFETLIEDVICNIEVISRCKKVLITDQVIYNYVQIGNSLTRGHKSDSVDAVLKDDKTYNLLLTKALEAYPSERYSVIDFVYIKKCLLLERAKKFDNPELLDIIRGGIAQLRDEMGFRIVLTYRNMIINKSKKILRKIVRR